jgi:hypothetical protein
MFTNWWKDVTVGLGVRSKNSWFIYTIWGDDL